jgi:hypothetical protein
VREGFLLSGHETDFLFSYRSVAVRRTRVARARRATEERLLKLNGLVQDLLEDKAHQNRQIEGCLKEIVSLREQVSKPTGNYASRTTWQDAGKPRRLTRNDQDKNGSSRRLKLGETLASPPPKKTDPRPRHRRIPVGKCDAGKGFEHTSHQATA